MSPACAMVRCRPRRCTSTFFDAVFQIFSIVGNTQTTEKFRFKPGLVFLIFLPEIAVNNSAVRCDGGTKLPPSTSLLFAMRVATISLRLFLVIEGKARKRILKTPVWPDGLSSLNQSSRLDA